MTVPQKAINAALGKTKEVKGIGIKQPNSSRKHEFNVKCCTIREHNGTCFVRGQISHAMAFKPDDQAWYTFEKTNGTITPSNPEKMIFKTTDGGLTALLKSAVGKLEKVRFFVDKIPFVSVDDLKTAVDILDKVDDHVDLDRDKGWVKTAHALIGEIARQFVPPRVSGPPRVELFSRTKLTGDRLVVENGKNVARLSGTNLQNEMTSLRAVVPDGVTIKLFKDFDFKASVLELGPGIHVINDIRTHEGNFNNTISSVKWEQS